MRHGFINIRNPPNPGVRLFYAARRMVRSDRHHIPGGTALLLTAMLLPALLAALPLGSSRTITLPFLQGEGPAVRVVFAGFAGCAGICPTGLATIAAAYRQIDPARQSRLGLTFVDVRTSSTHAVTQAYAHAFHSAFEAYATRAEERERFSSALSISLFPDSEAAAIHPGYLYVVARRDGAWRIARFYKSMPDAETLAADLTRYAQLYG